MGIKEDVASHISYLVSLNMIITFSTMYE